MYFKERARDILQRYLLVSAIYLTLMLAASLALLARLPG